MRATKAALIAATIVAAFALAFLAIGTAHRDRCLKAQETGCTLLPWSGHPPRSAWWNTTP